jgi:hypothetical protein
MPEDLILENRYWHPAVCGELIEILEETQSRIIARLASDPSGDARSGGLAFGVRTFDRSQLHTFTEETAEDADS